MKQIINYIKLSYKSLLWLMFLGLFLLQFRVYYEGGKFIYEILDEKGGYLDLHFGLYMYLFVFLPDVMKGGKVREKTGIKKSTKEEKIAFLVMMIYFILLFFLKKYETSFNGIFNGLQITVVTFLAFGYIDSKNKEGILKVLPISVMKRQIAMGIISVIIIILSLLSVESVVYVDKLLNSGDLAKLYSGSVKALFVVASLLCYRKFNIKKKREEYFTETEVYRILKGWK